MVGEVWIRMMDFIPYLSSPASSNPLGVSLHIRTARRSYPGADKGGQVLPISHQPALVSKVVIRRHKNGTSRTSRMCSVPLVQESWSRSPRPRDFRCAASHRFEIMVMIASCPATSTVQ
jgi:hypothetical protein